MAVATVAFTWAQPGFKKIAELCFWQQEPNKWSSWKLMWNWMSQVDVLFQLMDWWIDGLIDWSAVRCQIRCSLSQWVISQDRFTRFTIDPLTSTCWSTLLCQGQSSKFGWSKEIPCSSNVIGSWWFPSQRFNGQMSFPNMPFESILGSYRVYQYCISTCHHVPFFDSMVTTAWIWRSVIKHLEENGRPIPNGSLSPQGHDHRTAKPWRIWTAEAGHGRTWCT